MVRWPRLTASEPSAWPIARTASAVSVFLNDDVVSPDGQVHDVERTQFLQEHIAQVGRALGDGANIKGYLAWSLLDNFEWSFGLSKRFGIIRVDYDTQKRTPKDSYKWYADFIKQARGL